MSAGLKRGERVEDLREMHGAAGVESPAEMLSRMTPEQRARLGRLRSEQMFLLERGKPSPRLDPALASASTDDDMGRCVAWALASRRLMRRALRGT